MCKMNAYLFGNIRYSLLPYLKNTEFLVVPLNCSCISTWLSHLIWKSVIWVIRILVWFPMYESQFLSSFPVVKLLFFSYISVSSVQRNRASSLPLESKSIWYKKPHFHLKNTKASIRFWFTLVHWIIHSSSLFIGAEKISSLINFR